MRPTRSASDLWAKVRKHENLAIAPASVSLALGMTWAGARGVTAEEMGRVMHLGGETETMIASMGEQLRAWNDPALQSYELRVVDRLFGERTASFEPDFLALVERSFGAPLEKVDFMGNYDGARARINKWVEDSTKDRIVDLLPIGSVSAETRLVLTNAVYFKGDWLHPFEGNDTREQTFHVGGTRPANVKTMHQIVHVGHVKTDGLQMIELPYVGGDLAMDILLPARKDGLDELANALDEARFAALVGELKPTTVDVALPKFELEMAESLSLRDALVELGMRRAFGDADFTGISTTISPLFISQVFHKTFVAVDEEGTEAAAATAVVMATESTFVMPDSVPFIADHPFLFVLRDVHTGTIMFIGQLIDPR
jgi:serpin B